jgi:hypothetical protein
VNRARDYWRPFFMSDADIPNRFGPAMRWVIAGIALFVFFLIAAEKFNEGQYTAGTINAILFVVTFIIAVKWTAMANAWARWRGKMSAFFVGLGLCGALALGIALGGLLNRPGQLGFPTQSTGRIVWSFDQPVESYFLAMTRLNDEEIRVGGFQAHGKNTSTDPISEFSGFVRSDRTNEQRPIYLSAQDLAPDPTRPSYVPPMMIPTVPEETFGIPGLADFDIVTHDKPYMETGKDGVPLSQFLREFGGFTVILKYDGATVERHFSIEQIMAQIALLEKQSRPQNTSAPRVARKPTAKPPVQMLLPFVPAPAAPPPNTQQPSKG